MILQKEKSYWNSRRFQMAGTLNGWEMTFSFPEGH